MFDRALITHVCLHLHLLFIDPFSKYYSALWCSQLVLKIELRISITAFFEFYPDKIIEEFIKTYLRVELCLYKREVHFTKCFAYFTRWEKYLYRYFEDAYSLPMRLNGDCFSVVDNGCICVIFIMGYTKVYMSRASFINRHV